MAAKKVLILTCSHGSGHQMVTQALKESFLKRGCEVFTKDLFHETNAGINKIIEKSYLLSYGFGSHIYKKMYDSMEKSAHGAFIYKLWTLTRKTLLHLIDTLHPDCIINTYPYTISSILKREQYPDIPVFTVVTDFCIPAAWEHQDTDRFYVACDQVENSLIRFGISPDKIIKTGIPIRQAFYAPYDKKQLQKKYHLSPDKKTMILFAGTYGVLKNMSEICQKIDHFEQLQTIVICGKNHSLYQTLSAFHLKNTQIMGFVDHIAELYHCGDLMITKPGGITLSEVIATKTPVLSAFHLKNTQIMGFVDHIAELYHCGDLMITKPGGITLSEVIATKTPVILYKPVPGQENENAEWFKKCGAAIVTHTEAELLIAIESLKNNEVQQHSMKNALGKMNYGHSADRISDDILKQLNLLLPERSACLPALTLLQEM